MTLGSLASLGAALALVLALVALTLRLLRRYAFAGEWAGTGRIPLRVVQRVPLGPRQGIALVRIGAHVVAVSVGEGGVRTIAELDDAEAAPVLGAAPRGGKTTPPGTTPVTFRGALASALGLRAPALLMAAALTIAAPAARAQRPASAPAPSATVATAPLPGNTPAEVQAARQLARADSMVTRVAPRMDVRVGTGDGLRLSGTVSVVVMLGLLTLLPTLVLMMTGFTRILIVLQFLKQALGTQTTPPAQLIAALALLLTGFVMAPTLHEVNRDAITPWMDGKIEEREMLATAAKPLRAFMLRQTRESDLQRFVEMSGIDTPATVEDVPLTVLTSAFVVSELRTAFQMGFAIFLPFIVIDVVVASVLMSMGMFMLPPAMISLPFKLLLFVLVDGWTLVVQGLVASFH